MDKKKVIDLLEKAKYWEDDFILKYDAADFWALLGSLPHEKNKKIKKILQVNLTDTRAHKRTMELLINDITKGKYG